MPTPPQPPSNHDQQQQNPCTWHPFHRSRIGATVLPSEKRLSCNLIRQEAMEVHRTGQHLLNERRTQMARARRGCESEAAARIGLFRRAVFGVAATKRPAALAHPVARRETGPIRIAAPPVRPRRAPSPPNRGSREGGASPSESEAARPNAVRVRSSGRAPIRARPTPRRPPNSPQAAAALRHRCPRPRRTRTRAPAARC